MSTFHGVQTLTYGKGVNFHPLYIETHYILLPISTMNIILYIIFQSIVNQFPDM